MANHRPRTCLSLPRTLSALAVPALLAALAIIAGCSRDSTKPGPSPAGIPQAGFDVRLDPAASSFVLTRVPGTQPGRTPVEVELIGSHLAIEPTTETVSLDVAVRNVSRFELPGPAQVWLGDFTPPGVEVLNADYGDPPIRTEGKAALAGPTRFGFEYSALLGPDGTLSPGETSESRTWRFRVPGLGSFTFAAVATFGGPPGGPIISGLIFQDLDGDGVRDPADPPFYGGITLRRPDGTTSAGGPTDGGIYSFPVQDVGLHTLTFQPPALDCACEVVVTTPNPLQVVLLPDENGQPLSYEHADFGARIVQLGDVLPVVLTDLPPDQIRQDPYRMEVVGFDGDILELRVGFSGCTPFHDFPLFMSGGFMESNPVQARLVLGHDDHGEQCDAVFERLLRFDLTPVRRAFEQAYGLPGPVLLQLIDPQGVQHSFRYVWSPPVGQNLLPNGSFERGGQPTLEGWEVNNPALTSVVAGGAPGGDRWALRLASDWAPTTGFVRAPVPRVVPGQSLRLSAWMRAEGDTGGGMMYLASDSWTSAVVRSELLDWTPVELTATPPIAPGDTLWVVLSSPHTEIALRSGLFDNVVLEAGR